MQFLILSECNWFGGGNWGMSPTMLSKQNQKKKGPLRLQKKQSLKLPCRSESHQSIGWVTKWEKLEENVCEKSYWWGGEENCQAAWKQTWLNHNHIKSMTENLMEKNQGSKEKQKLCGVT